MKPSVGRIVHYCLTTEDAEVANRRRTTRESIRVQMDMEKWPVGAQAHIGNPATKGDILPMMIVKVDFATDHVNGQVFLDGADVLWVSLVAEGEGPGLWRWPPMQPDSQARRVVVP